MKKKNPKWKIKLIVVCCLVSFLSILACNTKLSKSERQLFLNSVELVRESLGDGTVYFTAEYGLYSNDTSYSLNAEDSLSINSFDVFGLKTKVIDSLRVFRCYIFSDINVDSIEFVDLMKSFIEKDSLYIFNPNNEKSIKVDCSKSNGVYYRPMYQPRW